jgi:hypothetical protein
VSRKGNDEESEFKNLISKSEAVAAVGSPSSTLEISLDILENAVDKKLVGEIVFLNYNQDGKKHFAMGQIAEIELRNPWLEDPTIRSLVRQKIQVNPVSGRQDTHLGKMAISAVFGAEGNDFVPSIVGTVPQTGTTVNRISDAILNHILRRYKDDLFYLGNIFGSEAIMPLWFKHFGAEKENGAGEAYHIGIFGKTGSGKSTLAQMILLAYARHPEMAIFIIDPVGEFSKSASGEFGTSGFQMNMSDVLRGLDRNLELRNVTQLILNEWDLFNEILIQSRFFDRVSITRSDKKEAATEAVSHELQHRFHITLTRLFERQSYDMVWQLLQEETVQEDIFQSRDARRRLARRIQDLLQDQNSIDEIYEQIWLPITQLFRQDREGAIAIEDIINTAYDTNQPNRPMVIIDLSGERPTAAGILWNETIQALVIKNLLDILTRSGQDAYRRNEFLNTLVVMDEAHRFVKAEKYDNEKEQQIKNRLINSVQETRKYGLGWMYISLSLSNIDRRIINQLSIIFFGYGLAMGSELEALRDHTGDSKALKLYQTFQHPRSTPDTRLRKFSFMTIGPVSPLSFTGTPLFFTAFTSQEDFLRINNLERSNIPRPKPEDEFEI